MNNFFDFAVSIFGEEGFKKKYAVAQSNYIGSILTNMLNMSGMFSKKKELYNLEFSCFKFQDETLLNHFKTLENSEEAMSMGAPNGFFSLLYKNNTSGEEGTLPFTIMELLDPENGQAYLYPLVMSLPEGVAPIFDEKELMQLIPIVETINFTLNDLGNMNVAVMNFMLEDDRIEFNLEQK